MKFAYTLAVAGALVAGPVLAQTSSPSTPAAPMGNTAPRATTGSPGTMTAPSGNAAPNANTGSPAAGTMTGSSNSSVNSNGNAPNSVNASGTVNMVAPSALEKGANSFTEGQARSRLEGAGLSNVTDLKKDDQGIWRGKAMRAGKSVTVGFDYKGNISAQ